MQTSRWLAEVLTPEHDRRATLYDKEFVGTILHWAAERGEKRLAERIFKGGLPISCVNTLGETPLHIAAREGQAELTQLLLSWEADIEAPDHDGRTPLWLAAQYGQPAVVKILLEEGADATVELRDDPPFTILHATIKDSRSRACQEDLGNVVHLLLNAAADPSKRSVPDQNALYWAMREYSTVVVPILLKAGAEAPDERLMHLGMTEAIRGHSEPMIKYLIEIGTNITYALSYAAGYGSLPIFRLIVDSAVEKFQAQDVRDNCLFNAVSGSNIETTEFLLSAGANPSARSYYGPRDTALHEAVTKKDGVPTARILVEAGSGLNAKNLDGETPLSLAVLGGNAGAVQFLIEAGANVLETDVDGKSLLHRVIELPEVLETETDEEEEERLFPIIELLLRHGVDINKQDNDGHTALEYTIGTRSNGIISLLMVSGADLGIECNGETLADLVGERLIM